MTLCKCLTVAGMLMLAGCNVLWGGFYKDPEEGALCDASVTGCQRNMDCPSGLCVDVQLGPYAPGSCVPADGLSYVDADGCTGTENGTFINPYCEVQRAVDSIQPQDQMLHIFLVKPSIRPYAGVRISRGNLALLGPWSDPGLKDKWDKTASATLLGTDNDMPTPKHPVGLDVQANSGPVEIIVDGLKVLAMPVTYALAVNIAFGSPGSKLTLRRTTVSGSMGFGVNVEGSGPSNLTMDRCKVTGNTGLGLGMTSKTTMFKITNSLFTLNATKEGNSGPAVTLDGPPGGIFDHNTITLNGYLPKDGAAGGINCMSPQNITNTIVLKNSIANGSQFLGNGHDDPYCHLHKTIVGDDQKKENIKDGLLCNPALDAEARLTAEQRPCAVDQATDNPDRNLDYFGTRRPQGQHSDIGFHELVSPDKTAACAP